MIKSKDIRKITRENLKGNWITTIGVLVTGFIIFEIINFILYKIMGGVSIVVRPIIVAPISFGIVYYLLNLSKKEQVYSNLFDMLKTKMIWKSMLIKIIYYIGILLTGIFVIVVLIGGTILGNIEASEQSAFSLVAISFMMIIGVIAAVLLIIILGIPAIIFAYIYSQIIFIAVEHEELGLKEIFKTSRMMMKKNKWRLFRLQITFIGWLFLSIITIGIGLIWLVPYYMEAMVVFHNEINKANNKKNYDKSEIVIGN